jgi:hypothetical protein
MNLDDLVAHVNGETGIQDSLESWRWLIPQRLEPFVATAVGGLFLLDESGVVWFLDIIAGTFDRAADSVADWERKLLDAEFLEWHFVPGFVMGLREAGLILSHGECYEPQHEPILGGSWAHENWTKGRWVFRLERQGRVHEAIKDLPDGTPIDRWSFEEL